MTAKLIDISHHQDWPSAGLLGTLDGIILRCAYNLQPDTKFVGFAANSKAIDLPWAPYQFIKPGDGAKQAEFAMKRLDAAGGSPLLFMDREYEHGVIASEKTADDYIERVKKAGLVTGTYMSLSIYQSHGADIDWPAFWSRLFNPVLPPTYHAGDFLQYAGDDSPPGNHIDRDIFNGSPSQLQALFNGGTAHGPHVPPIVPVPVEQQPGVHQGDAMYNLAPGVANSQKVIRGGAILYDRSVGGTRYSHVPDGQDTAFPFLGGANTDRIVIADGDYAVFALRSDVVESISQPKAYGK